MANVSLGDQDLPLHKPQTRANPAKPHTHPVIARYMGETASLELKNP